MMSDEEAMEAWVEANECIPASEHWGFFSMDESPVGIGGFTWFPTKQDMLQFFWEIIPPAMANESLSKVRSLCRNCRAHVRRHELGETSLEQLVEELNQSLKGATQIQWVGTFREMIAGRTLFCQILRAKFHAYRAESPVDAEHEMIDEDSSPRLLKRYGTPVDDADLEEFMDFLGEWGL